MRKFFVLACLLVGVRVAALGQQVDPEGTEMPKDTAAFYEAVRPYYELALPDMLPWHLKAHYQL